MDWSFLSGAPGAIGALASAIVSASKANTLAEEIKTVKREAAEAVAKVDTAIGKVEAALAVKAKEFSESLAAQRIEFLTEIRRRERPPLISQPVATSSAEAVDELRREVARDFADLTQRVSAVESGLGNVDRRSDRIEAAHDALAREVREALRQVELMLTRVSTRLEERVARRADRGSNHG